MSRLLPAVTLPLLALLGIAVLAAGSDVLELSDSDFDYTVAEHETMLVEFFAPWCGHCQKLAPEYESAATQLKGTVPLAKVDCTVNSQTCGRFGVNGYPTLKIFRNGQEASAYDGPRSAEGIVSYMKKQAGPNSTPLHSQEGLDTFINNFDASVVGFFSRSDSVLLAEFKKAASAMRDSYRFAHTTGLELGLKHGVEADVLLFRPPRLNSKFEENVLKFSDPISVSSLRRFIRDNIYGMCPHLTSENKDNLKNRDLVTAYYNVDYLRNPKGSNYWRNRILKVATQFQSRGLSFSVADRQEFQDDLEEDFGISPSDGAELPLITIRTREGHKYIMQEEFTRDGKALEKFLEDYFAGKLKRFLKSEPRPENNNGPVKVVVAETFEEIVNDPTKDVLIEFYAPWCGHCKNLEPKYTELGEQLADDHNIVIAKMDATANDVPSNYDVQGFPTIYFAKAGMKDSPMPYEGAREVKDLLSFLKKEATHPPILKREDEEQKVCS
uniref:Protein disulfide-isomerase n=1 Tax=Scleropages formosus TaxID=113540 RepID=A0A8C9RK30_SCLFO